MPPKVTHINMFLQEKFEFQRIARYIPQLINKSGFISNDIQLRNTCLIRSGVSVNKTGWISIAKQLALYEDNQWIYYDSVGTKYYVFKIVDEDFLAINVKGRVIKRSGGRRYLYQYHKHPLNIPCNGKMASISRLIKHTYEI